MDLFSWLRQNFLTCSSRYVVFLQFMILKFLYPTIKVFFSIVLEKLTLIVSYYIFLRGFIWFRFCWTFTVKTNIHINMNTVKWDLFGDLPVVNNLFVWTSIMVSLCFNQFSKSMQFCPLKDLRHTPISSYLRLTKFTVFYRIYFQHLPLWRLSLFSTYS